MQKAVANRETGRVTIVLETMTDRGINRTTTTTIKISPETTSAHRDVVRMIGDHHNPRQGRAPAMQRRETRDLSLALAALLNDPDQGPHLELQVLAHRKQVDRGVVDDLPPQRPRR